MRRYLKAIVFGGLIFAGSSCSDFLDINDNPNAPLKVPVTQLLPTIEERMASALGFNGLSLTASFFLTQNVTRGNLNDYNIQPANVQGSWNSLYQDCLTDLREMEKIAAANGYKNYEGVSKILKAYIYSILVDLWGDVPFSQAVLGSENFEPSFEPGQDVYAGVFALLDQGIADLKQPVIFKLTKTAQGGDLIYGSKAETATNTIETYWIRFANSLKLKLYNQTRLVDDVAAEVNAILAEGMIMTSQDHDFELPYGTSSNPDDRHPVYAGQYSAGTKTPPNPYFFEVMAGIDRFGHGGNNYNGDVITTADPRVPYYFYRQLTPTANAQNHPCSYMYNGHCMIYSFSFNLDPREGFDQSASSTVMGLYPIGGRYDDGSAAKANLNGYGRTPQRMLTHFAVLYILAELEMTEPGVVVPAAVVPNGAQSLFENAVRASFAKVSQIAAAAGAPAMSVTDVNNYVGILVTSYNNADADTKLRHLITQKWIASYGFAIDSFTDWRRTGYPILHDGNADSPPAPPGAGQLPSVTVRVRDYIVSFPYPDAELLLNDNAPPTQRNPYIDKVFWDN